jgi:Sec-independent protein secretion pathway component TatC
MAGDPETEHPDEAEGGPVKTFLEHLEDFRWVLIKSVVALFLAMLVCLFAANYVIQIIKWPLTRAPSDTPALTRLSLSASARIMSAIFNSRRNSKNR